MILRVGLATLLACVGLTWTAGASSAFATWGTVKITKVNEGGDQYDSFHFDSSSAIKAGGFDLKGGGYYENTKVHANAGAYAGAAYTVSEPASDTYELKSIACYVTAAYGKPVGSATTSLAYRKVSIKVGVGEKVACTFTNKRKTGKITVKKHLVPMDDGGKFDLQVDGKNVATQVGDGGYGSATVPTGTHDVGEDGTYLDRYERYTTCTKGYKVVAEGSGLVQVPVGAYDDIVCVVKNERKAKIVVDKHTVPADTGDPKTAFDFTLNPGATQFLLTDGQSSTHTVAPGKQYTVVESDPGAKGYKLTGLVCSSGSIDVATRTATVTPKPGEVVTCSYTNTKLVAAIDIDKNGPATAYSGDTLQFTYDVTNPGELRLHAVQVSDDKCPGVQGPEEVAGNGDDFLDPGELWRFTCSVVVTHSLGDPNPVTNTGTAQGTDDFDRKVEDEDKHDTLFLHPAIDIEKTGPATAVAGSTITYTLDVQNPGDMPFAQDDVSVTDPRCAAAPVRVSVNGDASDTVLNPGDHWTYQCSAQTAVGQASVVNVAHVQGTDENGKVVQDEDTFPTTLTQPNTPNNPQTPLTPQTPQTPQTPAAAGGVAGVTTVNAPRGTARLRGPVGCPRTARVKASVIGRQIRRVTFFVDGRRARVIKKADRNGRWTLSLRTTALRTGVHRVVARVQFTNASRTATRNLRVTVRRCAVQAPAPQFTG